MRSLLFFLTATALAANIDPVSAQEPEPQPAVLQATLPTEIIVTGKQPGPPMWRVKNGDNTLYIFAWLSPIPDNIYWESVRVEQVITEALRGLQAVRATALFFFDRFSTCLQKNALSRALPEGQRHTRIDQRVLKYLLFPGASLLNWN